MVGEFFIINNDYKVEVISYKKYKDYGANYMILTTTPSYNIKTIKL